MGSDAPKIPAVRADPSYGVAAHSPLVFLHAGEADLETALTAPTEGLLLPAAVTDIGTRFFAPGPNALAGQGPQPPPSCGLNKKIRPSRTNVKPRNPYEGRFPSQGERRIWRDELSAEGQKSNRRPRAKGRNGRDEPNRRNSGHFHDSRVPCLGEGHGSYLGGVWPGSGGRCGRI